MTPIAEPDPNALVNLLLGAIQAHNWRAVAVLTVVAAVWALRVLGGRFLPWLRTDRGGALLSLLTGVAASLMAVLVAGVPLTAKALIDGVLLGATAAGGWTLVKRLVFPADVVAAGATVVAIAPKPGS